MMKEYDLKNKVAIVTGAGRGIGKGIALGLAEAGADVIVAARTEEQIEQTASEIKEMGRNTLAVPTDVSNRAQVKNVVEKTISKFGRIDILVNNSGIDIGKPVSFVPGLKL